MAIDDILKDDMRHLLGLDDTGGEFVLEVTYKDVVNGGTSTYQMAYEPGRGDDEYERATFWASSVSGEGPTDPNRGDKITDPLNQVWTIVEIGTEQLYFTELSVMRRQREG